MVSQLRAVLLPSLSRGSSLNAVLPLVLLRSVTDSHPTAIPALICLTRGEGVCTGTPYASYQKIQILLDFL